MAEQTEHSHPNYVRIWIILLVLLVISFLGPMVGIKALTLITAFGIGVVKAVMVAANFMHLNIEKKIVWYILLACLLFLLVLFAGVAPDVWKDKGLNWTHPVHATDATPPAAH